EPGGTEDLHELIMVSVDVSDGHDALDSGPDVVPGRRGRGPGDEEQGQGQRPQSNHVPSIISDGSGFCTADRQGSRMSGCRRDVNSWSVARDARWRPAPSVAPP